MKGKLLAGGLLIGLVAPGPAPAQVDLGGQFSWGDEKQLALGSRLSVVWPFLPRTETMASFDYFFPDQGDYWEANVNIAHMVPVAAENLGLYAGVGFNWAHIVNGRGRNEFGLNLLAGVKYLRPAVTPFGEIRREVGGGDQLVITGGVMFRVGPGL
jgi:hypothetical protein